MVLQNPACGKPRTVMRSYLCNKFKGSEKLYPMYLYGMIAEARCCERCKSTNIVKNGRNCSGAQTYKCKDCGCFRVLDSKQPSRRLDPGVVERAFWERQSARDTARILGFSHRTVLNWLKKSAAPLPVFKRIVAPASVGDVLKLDELFTYIMLKVNEIRVVK